MATATLNNVLEQSALLPIPKNDAHVAFAVGADPNSALANKPLAKAPATRAPVILRDELTMLGAFICCSNHDGNASTPPVKSSAPRVALGSTFLSNRGRDCAPTDTPSDAQIGWRVYPLRDHVRRSSGVPRFRSSDGLTAPELIR
jgi:hypothetical protein